MSWEGACTPSRQSQPSRKALTRSSTEDRSARRENLRLFELYAKATPRPRLLKVTSSGGDITLGMELGEWVFRNGLDVEVVDHCFSSCANYVFTAGKAKYLNPDAVLM